MTTNPQPLAPSFTIAELCVLLNCSARTLYRLIDRGELPAFRLGRDYRVLANDVERFTAPPVTEATR